MIQWCTLMSQLLILKPTRAYEYPLLALHVLGGSADRYIEVFDYLSSDIRIIITCTLLLS